MKSEKASVSVDFNRSGFVQEVFKEHNYYRSLHLTPPLKLSDKVRAIQIVPYLQSSYKTKIKQLLQKHLAMGQWLTKNYYSIDTLTGINMFFFVWNNYKYNLT